MGRCVVQTGLGRFAECVLAAAQVVRQTGRLIDRRESD